MHAFIHSAFVRLCCGQKNCSCSSREPQKEKRDIIVAYVRYVETLKVPYFCANFNCDSSSELFVSNSIQLMIYISNENFPLEGEERKRKTVRTRRLECTRRGVRIPRFKMHYLLHIVYTSCILRVLLHTVHLDRALEIDNSSR